MGEEYKIESDLEQVPLEGFQMELPAELFNTGAEFNISVSYRIKGMWNDLHVSERVENFAIAKGSFGEEYVEIINSEVEDNEIHSSVAIIKDAPELRILMKDEKRPLGELLCVLKKV